MRTWKWFNANSELKGPCLVKLIYRDPKSVKLSVTIGARWFIKQNNSNWHDNHKLTGFNTVRVEE